MIAGLIAALEPIIMRFGAIGVFLASVLEEVISPIPSALVVMGSAFFLMDGHALSWASVVRMLVVVILPAAAGITFGSLTIYGIAYGSGKPILVRWGKYFGIEWSEIEKIHAKFSKGHADEFTLFLIRAVPAIPSVAISAVCGLLRMPVVEYVVYSFLGTTIRAFLLALAGWQLGNVYRATADTIGKIENYVLAGLIIVVAVFVVYKISKRPKSSPTQPHQ